MPDPAAIRIWLAEQLAATPWLLAAVAVMAFLRPAVKVLLGAARDLRDLWNVFATPDRRRRAAERRAAAEYLRNDLLQTNAADAWDDEHYAELEAEIEAEGRRFWGWLFYRRAGLRRERSLSAALRHSSEKRIVLLGEPGSGKSVALRHIALKTASAAARTRVRRHPLPLYINLRTLRRPADRRIDASLIREHVLSTINRRDNAHLQAFLQSRFDSGITTGEWVFLFDSFDEIPDILSATEDDAIVRQYSDAIADFLSAFNRCRAVVASREFRAPHTLVWPRFRVLPLSDERRRQLVQRFLGDSAARNRVLGNLQHASAEIERVSRNPLFLRLLSEYVEREGTFPDQLHRVLHNFVEARLERDRARIWARHGIVAATLATAAEEMAAHMLIQGLGLEIDVDVLVERVDSRAFEAPVRACMEALELTGLARLDRSGPKPLFSFVHRRFQEYFATQYVMRNSGAVSVEQLLTDGRWRETAVVLMQTSSHESLARLLRTFQELAKTTLRAAPVPEDWRTYRFEWPGTALHVLSLLQDGLARRSSLLPKSVGESICELLRAAWNYGSILDRKWALEVAGAAPDHTVLWLLRRAFATKSRVLADAAYRQTARLEHVPPDVEESIRRSLLAAYADGTLRRERETTTAFVERIPRSRDLLHALHFLLSIRWIDAALHAGAIAFVVTHRFYSAEPVLPLLDFVSVPLLLLSFLTLRTMVEWRRPARSFGAVLALVCRGLAVVSVWVVAELANPPGYFAFVLFWPPLALEGIRAGHFVRPLLRPLMFLWPLASLFQGIPPLRHELHRLFMPTYVSVRGGVPRRRRREAWKRLVRKRWMENIPAYMGLMSIMLTALLLIWITYPPVWQQAIHAGTPEVRWTKLGIFAGVVATLLLAVFAVDGFRTWRTVRRIDNHGTVASLMRDLRAVLFNTNRMRIARTYRLRNALPPTSATAEELVALCTAIEDAGLRLNGPDFMPVTWTEALRRGLGDLRYRTSTALLDELVLLTEAVRARGGARPA